MRSLSLSLPHSVPLFPFVSPSRSRPRSGSGCSGAHRSGVYRPWPPANPNALLCLCLSGLIPNLAGIIPEKALKLGVNDIFREIFAVSPQFP